jgi:hypothetical protein
MYPSPGDVRAPARSVAVKLVGMADGSASVNVATVPVKDRPAVALRRNAGGGK